MVWRLFLGTILVGFAVGVSGFAAAAGPDFLDPAKAGPDFQVQGEYQGKINVDGQDVPIGVQIIALGEGRFEAVSHVGGLPGDGWDGAQRDRTEGRREGETVSFQGDSGRGTIRNGALEIESTGGARGTLEKVQRESPTLGRKPPSRAVVLFDGSSADQFEKGTVSDDQLLMPGCTSREKFGDCEIHIEFKLPFEPQDRGQGRGNSGIYVQGRYEVQMLDSFGLEGKNNECGGLYGVRDPDVNMCFPPLSWQTYDIIFTAGRYDDQGELQKKPRITVRHNGVLIHRDVELPGESTRGAPVEAGPEPGPIYLQDHGSPVRYRNIWVSRLSD